MLKNLIFNIFNFNTCSNSSTNPAFAKATNRVGLLNCWSLQRRARETGRFKMPKSIGFPELRDESQPEAQIVVMVVGCIVVAISHAAVRCIVVPTATTIHTVGAPWPVSLAAISIFLYSSVSAYCANEKRGVTWSENSFCAHSPPSNRSEYFLNFAANLHLLCLFNLTKFSGNKTYPRKGSPFSLLLMQHSFTFSFSSCSM